MLRSELLAILANPESSGVEFKRDDIKPQKLAKELVAFANLEGGIVLLGVDDDDHSVVGLRREKVEEWVMGAARDLVRPPLVPYVQVLRDVEPGRDVAVVRVTRGYAVHSVYRNHHHTYYVRAGSTSREADPEEVARIGQQRGLLRAELQPVSGTSLDDLDPRRLREYLADVREQEAPADYDNEGWLRLLSNLELMLDGEHGGAASVAGLVLFGRRVEQFLPHAGIDAMSFPGVEKDYAAIERTDLRGPIVRFGLEDPPQEGGLIEQALAFVQRNTRPEAGLDTGGRRIDRPAYPREAVREALVNSVVHRDYLLTGTNVELAIYADRLEVISPGRLPNDITPEAMRLGARSARNQLLKDVMRDYRYLEHMGMGVARKIVAGMREHNGTDPDLEEHGERFLVRLHR